MTSPLYRTEIVKEDIAIGASATVELIKQKRLSDGMSPVIVDADVAADPTVTTGVTLVLQHRVSDDNSWTDVKSANITTDGRVTLTLNPHASGDASNYPLRTMLRVVVKTGAGDALTITKAQLTRNN